jgi:hypothetical protein
MIYNYEATGGIAIYGDGDESNAYKGSGYLTIYGSSICVCRPKYVSDGFINATNTTSSLYNFNIDFLYSFSYDINQSFEASYDFSYNVGELPLRTFRVTGRQYYNSDYIPFCGIPNGLNRMFQELIARNLQEVCQFLSDVNWTWPIETIERSVHPIESFFAIGSTGIATNGEFVPTSQCFEPVPFSQIPQCLQFTVLPTPTVKMGVSTSVLKMNVFAATGGIVIGGSVKLTSSYVGSGIILLSGSAEFSNNYFGYIGSGDSLIYGESELVYSYRTFEGSGNIIVGGNPEIISPSWRYNGSGSIVVSNDALVRFKLSFVSTGKSDTYPTYAGIIIYGEAEYPILQNANGVVLVSGISISGTPYIWNYAEGNAFIFGTASIVSPYFYYESDGAITVGGSIFVKVASYAYEADSGFILIDGTGEARDSSLGDFWYTTILSPILLEESSLSFLSGYKYKGSGIIDLSGTIASSLFFADNIGMGMAVEISNFEVSFSESVDQVMIPISETINTACGLCDAIPKLLYLKHNFDKATVLKKFLDNNGFSLSENIEMFYSARTESWQRSFSFTGIGSTNVAEKWQINIEWSCVNYFGENELSSNLWKFSLYVNKTNLVTGDDVDSRILAYFPSEDICVSASSYGLDFTINVHFRDNFVINNFNVVVDNFTIYDSIGLFNGTYWDANTLNCRILEKLTLLDVSVIDITSIRPQAPTQFYL